MAPIAISIGLAAHLGVHPDHRLLHVRAGLGLPHVRRHLLVGQQARRCQGRATTPAGSTSSGSSRSTPPWPTARRRSSTSSFSTIEQSWAAGYSLHRVFWLFLVVLVLTALINIFGGHILAMLNNISVWWHVVGAAVIIAILVFLPEKHMSINDVFTMRVNNSGGLAGGETSGCRASGSTCCPLGFLLTQYTITGYDASAHLSEETHSAADACRQGHLAVDLLLRHRWLGAPARLPLRGPGPRGGHGGRWRRGRHLRPGAAAPELGRRSCCSSRASASSSAPPRA